MESRYDESSTYEQAEMKMNLISNILYLLFFSMLVHHETSITTSGKELRKSFIKNHKTHFEFSNSSFHEHTKLMVQHFHIIQNLSLQENKELDIQEQFV